MDYYEDKREDDEDRYLSKKIRCCRKCGKELHYKEIFYNSDKVCNRCKGLPEFW